MRECTKQEEEELSVPAYRENEKVNISNDHRDDGEDVKGGDPGSNIVSSGPEKETFIEAATSEALRPFVIISSSYLLFTITDGAIRMIVLLHAYNKNFSALEVSIMFTLYELAGVFTNLV